MSYKEYIIGDRTTAEIRTNVLLRLPETMSNSATVAHADSRAARTIEELETIIANLREYRQDLAARYGQLATMSYTRLLKLERCRRWDNRISYTINIVKIFSDGTEDVELFERFEGKERHKAFARAAELRKQFPGIPYEQDTEKRNWER